MQIGGERGVNYCPGVRSEWWGSSNRGLFCRQGISGGFGWGAFCGNASLEKFREKGGLVDDRLAGGETGQHVTWGWDGIGRGGTREPVGAGISRTVA